MPGEANPGVRSGLRAGACRTPFLVSLKGSEKLMRGPYVVLLGCLQLRGQQRVVRCTSRQGRAEVFPLFCGCALLGGG